VQHLLEPAGEPLFPRGVQQWHGLRASFPEFGEVRRHLDTEMDRHRLGDHWWHVSQLNRFFSEMFLFVQVQPADDAIRAFAPAESRIPSPCAGFRQNVQTFSGCHFLRVRYFGIVVGQLAEQE